MREIKFRGKDIDCNEWRYGSLVKVRENDGYLLYYIVDEENQQWIALPETVGQYTGLKDKNGKEIYEGDILEAENRLWQIGFRDGCFVGVDFKNVAWDELVNIGYGETKVIGNVFEDSELLEVV